MHKLMKRPVRSARVQLRGRIPRRNVSSRTERANELQATVGLRRALQCSMVPAGGMVAWRNSLQMSGLASNSVIVRRTTATFGEAFPVQDTASLLAAPVGTVSPATIPGNYAVGLPFSGRWSGQRSDLVRNFDELATKLGDLLDYDATHAIVVKGAAFARQIAPLQNRVDRLPVLIACLAHLPIPERDRDMQSLIPLVRAVIPEKAPGNTGQRSEDLAQQDGQDGQLDDQNDFYGIADVFKHDADANPVRLIDEMYLRAARYDSQAIADLTDTVLCRLATDPRGKRLVPRLASRFYELHLIEDGDANSLTAFVHRLALAHLQLLQLAAGDPAEQVLHQKTTTFWTRARDFKGELSHVIATADKDILDAIGSWLDIRVAMFAAGAPELVAAWQEEDAATERAEEAVWGDNPVRKRREINRLTVKLRDVRRLHDCLIAAATDADDGADAENDSHGSEPACSSHGNADGKVLHDRPTVTANAEDDGEEADGSRVEEDASGIVVIPMFEKSGNRELDERLKLYRDGLGGVKLPLVSTPDLAPIRAELVRKLPHLETIIDRILNSMVPHPYIKLPPVLLVGRPGCGKTTLLEELAQLLGTPSLTIDGAGISDANLLGVDQHWGTGGPGVHLNLVVENEIANPILIFDELEKAGGSRRNGDIRTKLLGLLEPRRAGAFLCPFLGKPTNLSGLNWVFSANSSENIPLPLLNRLETIKCPLPAREHLGQLAPQLLAAEYASRGLHTGWAAPLTPDELVILRRHWQGGSIRNLKRLISAVVSARDQFMTIA